MKKTILRLKTLSLCCLYFNLQAQDYSLAFEKRADTITKSTKEDVIKEYRLKAKNIEHKNLVNYKLLIEIDPESSLPTSDYELNVKEIDFNNLKDGYPFYLKIKPDSKEDRERALILLLKEKFPEKTGRTVKNLADEKEKRLIIVFKAHKSDSLNGYSYLGYLGTNFDLVDGVKAQNLFFATNIFIPAKEKKLGFSVSIYGNRSFTSTDTIIQDLFTSKIIGSGDSTWYYRSRGDKSRTWVTDNIGASFSPLLRLTKLSCSEFDVYFSPLLEFIWRRHTISNSYTNVLLVDSSRRAVKLIGTLETPLKAKTQFGVYDFYFGGGLTIAHENEKISVRLFLNVAKHLSYYPVPSSRGSVETNYDKAEPDLSFCGRLWITEPSSGVTLQAEIFNNLKYPRPYYGVTLSKAFNLKNLSTFFQPLTAR